MSSLTALTGQVARALAGGLTDRETTAGRKLLLLGGFTASGLRLAAGTSIGRLGPRPERPLRLWDFERCSHSRMVREALSTLDLDAEIRPCPIGGTRFRPELEGRGVPRLEDPNAGVVLTRSGEIVDHLYARYGARPPPRLINRGPLRVATAIGVRLLTADRGSRARPSRAPAQALELWQFESSPFSRFVRCALCELELPYLLHNVAKGSPRRKAFVAMSGKMQVPYLFDPNTGVRMFESLRIERYLEETYGGA